MADFSSNQKDTKETNKQGIGDAELDNTILKILESNQHNRIQIRAYEVLSKLEVE